MFEHVTHVMVPCPNTDERGVHCHVLENHDAWSAVSLINMMNKRWMGNTVGNKTSLCRIMTAHTLELDVDQIVEAFLGETYQKV